MNIQALPRRPTKSGLRDGFTLIEMSIVLVIIGLIVGGVLMGQDLVSAGALRAQISQIEKYNTAVNTFRVKYGYLPGDIPDPYASSFGFQARGQYGGEGDGNGQITGISADAANSLAQGGDAGELAMFWVDLSTAGLIEGGFNTATTHTALSNWASDTLSNAIPIGQILPRAKITNNYVYIWNGVLGGLAPALTGNYFAVSGVVQLGMGQTYTSPQMTASQAFAIDKKVDDGFPQSGNVIAQYLNIMCCSVQPEWAIGDGLNNASTAASTGWPNYAPTTAATPGSPVTCYDNRSGNGPQQYSTEISNGSGPNCALSFKMQGAGR